MWPGPKFSGNRSGFVQVSEVSTVDGFPVSPDSDAPFLIRRAPRHTVMAGNVSDHEGTLADVIDVLRDGL